MFDHEDRLRGLNGNLPLGGKLGLLHTEISRRHPFVARLAVATFDPKRRVLKTFLSSGGEERSPVRYEARLEDAPMLMQILRVGRPRVVNDLRLFADGTHAHTQAIASAGYGAIHRSTASRAA